MIEKEEPIKLISLTLL